MSRYFITGSQGFIGSWIIKKLLDNGYVNDPSDIVAVDLSENLGIFKQILNTEQISKINREYFNITNFNKLQSILNKYKPNYVIHLAGLQIPACRSKPILGAMVNVIGTINTFEAVKQYNDKQLNEYKIKSIIYASSAGICGKKEDYLPKKSIDDFDTHIPRTHYGIYKLCNEGTARIYFQNNNIPSVGLRPLTVFGVGRELGLTSDATKAIKSAVLNREFKMGYKGTTLFHYVEDMAELFIRCSKQCAIKPGAYSCNIRGNTMDCREFLETLYKLIPNSRYKVKIDENKAIILPFPDSMTQISLDNLFKGEPAIKQTSISKAIERVVKQFKELKKQNRLHTKDLPSKL